MNNLLNNREQGGVTRVAEMWRNLIESQDQSNRLGVHDSGNGDHGLPRWHWW